LQPAKKRVPGAPVPLLFLGLRFLGCLPPNTSIVVTSVTGLGDDAYYLAVGSNVGLIVKKGNIAFKVAVYASSPLDKKQALQKTLAQQVLSSL